MLGNGIKALNDSTSGAGEERVGAEDPVRARRTVDDDPAETSLQRLERLREALLRMKERAHEAGYRAIIGIRLETSQIAPNGRQGKGTAGVEVLASGTALRLAQ